MKIYFENFSDKHIVFSKSIRDDFNSRNYQGDQLIEAARVIITVHLVRCLNNDLNGKKIYHSLIKHGYSNDEIVNAMAEAWLNSLNYFELHDLKKKLFDNLIFRNIGLPIFFSFILSSLILAFLYKFHPSIFIDFFAAPPTIAILCGILFILLHKIFKIR